MAKYPRLFGNSVQRYNIHNSSGVALAESDSVFDTYIYTNAGDDDNTQRSTAVVIIKNEQVAGTVTNLRITSISLKENATGSDAYTGTNVSLNPMVSNVPFMGAQEGFSAQSGNKVVAKDTGNKPGLASDTTAGLEIGQIKVSATFTNNIPNTGGPISVEDINPELNSNFRSILLHNPETITAASGQNNPIPSDSYAAFTVAFHPTENIVNNHTECYLKINTSVGNVVYPLVVNSFNEIIMVARKGTSQYGDTNPDLNLTIGSSNIYDNGTVNLGYHPRTNNETKLQDDLLADGIKILDVSPAAVDASYRFVNSTASSGTFIDGDGATLNIPANHTAGVFDHFLNETNSSIKDYYTDEVYYNTLALSGTTSVDDGATLFDVPGNSSLCQFFTVINATTSIIDGTNGSGGYITNYALNDFARALLFRVNYLSEQYNNTNVANDDFLDDGTGFNNQFFKYVLTYGVYQKVTIPSNQISGIKNEIDASTEFTTSFNRKYDTSGISAPNGLIAQTGGTYNFSHSVRWNNYRGTDVNGKTSLEPFAFGPNSNNFKYLGTNTNDCVPTSFTIGSTTSTSGSFSYFKWDDPSIKYRDVTISSPIKFKLTPAVYFGSQFILALDSTEGDSFLMNPVADSGGTIESKLVPDAEDNVWNFNDSAVYPGLHSEHTIAYKARFYPRDPYLKIGMLTESSKFDKNSASPGYVNGTGLLKDSISTTELNDVSTWFNSSSAVISNTTSNFDTNQPANKMYSGFGGAVFEHNTFATNIQCLVGDATYNTTKKSRVDKNGASINEFFPFNKILKFPVPQKHASSDKFIAFQSFIPFNEGDSNIYLHSIDVLTGAEGVGNEQLLDFNAGSAGNNENGTAIYGYKPAHNTNNANAGSSNDPVLSFLVDGMDTVFNTSEKRYHRIVNPELTTSDPAKFYRGFNGGSAYYPPKFMQGYNNTDSDVTDYLFTVNETGIENQMDCNKISKWIGNSEQAYPEASNGTSGATGPKGNLPIHLRMEVAAKGSAVDFGSYYATLKIRYFKHDYFSEKKAGGEGTTVVTGASDFRIHEMRIIVKMDVELTPLLSIADSEGEEFTNSSNINLGNVNIG